MIRPLFHLQSHTISRYHCRFFLIERGKKVFDISEIAIQVLSHLLIDKFIRNEAIADYRNYVTK